MKLGEILEGKLKGRKLVLEPRGKLKPNEYLVEKGVFIGGMPQFAVHCLICEKEIPGKCDVKH